MWEDGEDLIKAELGQGENLLWAGRPRFGIVLRPWDALLIPFSFMWGGFAISWEVAAISSGAPLFFILFGVPFVVFGLYLIVGRFVVDARRREKSYYGLSTERIIIISGLFRRVVKSLDLRTLTDVSVAERADGSGTITFGPTQPMHYWLGGAAWPGTSHYGAARFEMIENAKEVYDQIRQAQAVCP